MVFKKIGYEQRGPMAPFAHDAVAVIFEEIINRLGLTLTSQRDRFAVSGYSGGMLRFYRNADGKRAREFFFLQLGGETDNTVVRRRLYFDESLAPNVEQILKKNSVASGVFSGAK